MNKIISDSIRLTQITYNDEVHFKNNESQLKTITSKNLQKFKHKLQLLSLISKKEFIFQQQLVSKKDNSIEHKDVAEVMDKKEKLSTKKNTKNELEMDSDELENLEGFLLNQQIMQPAIPSHLKKQLIEQGVNIKANNLYNKINNVDEKNRTIDFKSTLSTLNSKIKNKKLNINQQEKLMLDSQLDKKEDINTIPLLKNNNLKYKLESEIRSKYNNKIYIGDLNSSKISSSKNKLDDGFIERKLHHGSMSDESKITSLENEKLLLNNKLNLNDHHVFLDSDLKSEIKNRKQEQLQNISLINTNMLLTDVSKSQSIPQIKTSFLGNQLLNLSTWNILHKIDTLSIGPNNITYVFKRWGNNDHQVQIRFALENQIRLIASTGRVYQASFENLNQYQGRSTLSLENNEKNSYTHINSIDADKHKEDEY
ncbi:hypothetical protein [Proteus sp. TJ1640]|uniref:hypothetical protein n=1 Tax=Proteus sp. TJ1640 TaxID=2050968 RepID=UPI000D68A51B|nr:hypothetical protein [Proteus sp. TJ1640]